MMPLIQSFSLAGLFYYVCHGHVASLAHAEQVAPAPEAELEVVQKQEVQGEFGLEYGLGVGLALKSMPERGTEMELVIFQERKSLLV